MFIHTQKNEQTLNLGGEIPFEVQVQIPFQEVQKHDPSNSEHEEGTFHVFEAQLGRSSLLNQAFHPT